MRPAVDLAVEELDGDLLVLRGANLHRLTGVAVGLWRYLGSEPTDAQVRLYLDQLSPVDAGEAARLLLSLIDAGLVDA